MRQYDTSDLPTPTWEFYASVVGMIVVCVGCAVGFFHGGAPNAQVATFDASLGYVFLFLTLFFVVILIVLLSTKSKSAPIEVNQKIYGNAHLATAAEVDRMLSRHAHPPFYKFED